MSLKHMFTLLGFLVVGGVFTLFLGQDINFDLKNYHFYNAYSYVNNRYDYDLSPAQLQNYLNPLLDVIYYKLVAMFSDPIIITFIMGFWYGLLAWCIFRLIILLQPKPNIIMSLSGTILGVSGVAALGQAGTTTNEVATGALMMLSLLLSCRGLKIQGNNSSREIRLSGLIAGITTGLKLTAASYSIAILVGIVLLTVMNGKRARASAIINFGLLSAFGFLLAGGYWHYFLWHHYDNPVFPFYNNVFKSDYYEHASLYVSAWRRTTLENLFLYPFELSQIARLKKEEWFSDPRLLLGFISALILLGTFFIQQLKKPLPSHHNQPAHTICLLLLPATWLMGYLIWAYTHGNYRYTVFLEVLSSILFVILLYQSRLPTRWLSIILILVTLFSIHSTTYLSWGRIHYGKTTFDVRPPQIKNNSMVIMLSGSGMSYVIPFFPKEVKFIYPQNNLNSVDLKNKLQQHINQTINNWTGPVYAMAPNGYNFMADKALNYFSLDVNYMGPFGCQPLLSNIDNNALQICELKINK